jgi:hypothetical protein
LSGDYHDTSTSTYDQHGYPPRNDVGTFTLSLKVVSRQSNVAAIGGTVSITGYPEGTISMPINSSTGFGSSETRSGNERSIFVTAQQAGPDSLETVTFSGVIQKREIIGDFAFHDYSDGGYSTPSVPVFGTPVLLAQRLGTPGNPFKLGATKEDPNVKIEGVPDDPAWQDYKNKLHALLKREVFIPESKVVPKDHTLYQFVAEYHPDAEGRYDRSGEIGLNVAVPYSKLGVASKIQNDLAARLQALDGKLPQFPVPHPPLNLSVSFTFNDPNGDTDVNNPLEP